MRRRLWQAYFFLALVLTVAGLALPFFVEASAETAWWEWMYMPIYVVQLVGLFGFVFSRRLGIAPIWQAVFVIGLAYEAWSLFSTATDPELKGTGYGFLVMTVATTLVLQLPMFIGLFLYGFRCKELWHGAARQDADVSRT